MPRSNSLRWTFRAIAIVSLGFAAATLYDTVRVARLPARAKTLRIGDTKADVIRVLGQPSCVFGPDSDGGWFSHPLETWDFGSHFETDTPFFTEFPWFLPMRWRLFGPHPQDVAVEFDSGGRISSIGLPDE